MTDQDKTYYWPDGSLKWGDPLDVGHLILQLQTLDPAMKVSSVMFIEFKGKRYARAHGLSMSRERWDDGGFLNFKLDVPECLAIWAYEPQKVDGPGRDILNSILAESQLHWTTTKPTVEGWYWWKENEAHIDVLRIELLHGKLCVCWDEDVTSFLEKMPGEWSSGPLVPPEEG